MSNYIQSDEYKRQTYERILAVTKGTDKVNPGVLRVLANSRLASANSFSFDFSDTKSRKEKVEILLQKSDDFIATHGVFGLVKVPRSANEVNNWSIWDPQTFANPDVFGANYAKYETVWAGMMSATTGSVVRLDSLPTSVFRNVPCFEEFTVGSDTVKIAKKTFGQDLFSFEPFLKLAGNETHKVSIEVPSLTETLEVANFSIFPFIEFYGYRLEDLRETR